MARKSKQQKLKDKSLEYLKRAIASNEELVLNYKDGLDAYMAKPYGNEIEGRSQVVMTDVADTIEWIMPSLMKIFFGGAQVVDIKPQGKDDEESAKLMEEKVNFDFQRGMNGYTVLHDWMKDALIGKYGVVKYWWEDKVTKRNEAYQGLNEAEFQQLSQDTTYEVVDVEGTLVQPEVADFMGNIISPEQYSYDVTGKRLKKISRPMAMVVPAGEFVFDLETPASIKDSDFCAHKMRVHKNYLKRYKVSEKDIDAELDYFSAADIVKEALFEDIGGLNFVTDDIDDDFVYLYECYLNDYDDMGDKVPKKVVIFGNKVLEVTDNSYGHPPFCGITTVRIPHRAAGLSMADLVADLQKLKTGLMRAILDNMYYQNNGIDIVNPYRINMDDVIDRNEPGAKWRTLYDVDPNTVISSKTPNPLPQQAFGLLETVENIKERRTGVTSYNQGLDSKSLNKTATGISQIMGAAQQRMELIARNFAETGVKELFQAFVDMNLEYFDAPTNIKLNEEWVNVRPEDIDGDYDIIIDVGVGTGAQEIQINQLINMINVSAPGMQQGVVTKKDMYNMLKSIYELMGYKNPDKFVTDPESKEAKQAAQGDPRLKQMQQEMQKLAEQLKKAEDKKQVEMAKVQVDNRKVDVDELEVKLDYEIDKLKLKQDAKSKQLDITKDMYIDSTRRPDSKEG